jgi:hypothetical protein
MLANPSRARPALIGAKKSIILLRSELASSQILGRVDSAREKINKYGESVLQVYNRVLSDGGSGDYA